MDSFLARIQNKLKRGVSTVQTKQQKETSEPPYRRYINETYLPENFGTQVLQLEQTIESGTGTIQELNRLIFLFKLVYMIFYFQSAIEYYQERHNDKYFYFNYKLKSIWNKHAVKAIIDVQQSNKENHSQQVKNSQHQKIKSDRQQQIMKHEHNIDQISKSISKEQIEGLIVQKHNDLQSSYDFKQNEINQQRDNLFKKIVKRNQLKLVDSTIISQKNKQLVHSFIQL